MILNSLQHHQKKTAWTLLFIFYAEIVTAARLERNMEYSSAHYNYTRIFESESHHVDGNSRLLRAGSHESKQLEKLEISKRNKLKSPINISKIQIGGPGQPEMQAFQSVNANNMVDLFSGDFSYNIPLLDVGGYPLGISYRSGATMDQEASWVGLGWNINPGTIMRNVRGLPDDFNGTEKITKQYNIRKNWTAGITATARPEIFGLDIPKLGLNIGAFYNNYNGIGFELGSSITANPGKYITTTKTTDEKTADTKIDSGFTTKFGGSIGFTLNSQNGLNLNASMMMKYGNEDSKINGFGKIGANYNSRSGLQDLTLSAENYNNNVFRGIKYNNGGIDASYDIADISFAKSTYTPTVTIPFTSYGFSLTLKGGAELFGLHPLGALRGYYSSQYIAAKDKVDSLPAYGYMHYQKGNRDDRALLDFNREKDVAFRSNSPNAAIPFYTYDSYSITGEGIGGSFRPYRGDVGYIRDHNLRTKSGSGGIGIDLGAAPNLGHFGGDLQFNYTTLTNRRWDVGNLMERNVRFATADSTYEPVYFRNPAEQTSNTQEYYDKIGGDDVVRVALAGGNIEPVATNQLKRFDKQKFSGAVTITSPIVKDKRDKRSQVISYLTAAEAEKVGLDTIIKSYPINVFPKGKCDNNFEIISRSDGVTGIRKPNHISEVTVLNNDGRRYVYGIPAYNLSQKEVTFAVSSYFANSATGLVSYVPGIDNSVNNSNGKDNFFSSETTPAFAHSFLLTGVLSADYVDITGDGITEDDNGDAVKFNYSRMKWDTGINATTSFKWRTPYDSNMASYNEGLKSDRSDDKGNYVYGEKEIWYMNSIESKTMIAIFILDEGTRLDDISVLGENGGQALPSRGLKRLKQIKLYSKSDYYKNPSKARPIKTVNFAYSYKLCTGAPAAYGGVGKLTLDSLWFTYNGNNRSLKSKYRFTYNSNNPSYNNRGNDRWGNYKPVTDNPSSLTNAEFPYAVQDKVKANDNAGAWNLTQIKLPSGAKISAEYESDDYAYVQNKRAMDMYRVVAMGTTNVYTQAKQLLYDNSNKSDMHDCQFVFVRVPSAVSSKDEVYRKYLEGVEKIYFRVSVKIPGVTGLNAFEQVPFYGELEQGEYGLASANIIWVKLKEFGKTQSFPATAAIQFLRLNLPGKAYPGSDVINDDAGPAPAIQAITGMGKQFKDAIVGFSKSKRQESVCQQFDSTRSFARFNNPDYCKYGGGYRVKRIVIADNWTAMTGQKESYYGQEYDYSTTREVFYDSSGTKTSKTIKISSGVASYEPNVGNEENPFRQPIEYQESVTMAPTDYFYTEYPYCESLFPSPSVGYSKVTVSSINKRNLKSFNGWEETEFYTNYDFPTVTDFTTFDKECKKTGKRKYSLINALSLKRTTLSQGFKIELNDMNGKVKSQKSYAANDSIHPISYTINYYKTKQDNIHGTYLSNTVPIIDSANGKVNPNGTIGKDIELMMDFREQTALSSGVAVNLNAETMLFFVVPVTIPAFFPVISIDDNRFRSAVTVKVIQRYGILDSVLHYEKGSLVSTQNVVYDAQTGDVLLSRTQNEFNDPIYNFNYPAHWAYSGMEPAYRNIAAVFGPIDIAAGRVINSVGHYGSLDKYFESGDEILLDTPGFNGNANCSLTMESLRAAKAKRLWVVDINKATGGAGKQFYLIDRFGNPFTGSGARIKIIRSGKRNTASASIGTVTSLREPLDKSNPLEWKLKLDSTIGVIATGAGIYKDFWNVDNRFVSEYRCDTTTVNDSLIEYGATISALKKYAVFNSGQPPLDQTFTHPDVLAASYEYQHFKQTTAFTNCRSRKKNCSGSGNSIQYFTRTMLQFDYLNQIIPQGAVITDAKLNLPAKKPLNLWSHNSATSSTDPGNCISYWPGSVSVAHDYFDRVHYPNSNSSTTYNNAGFVKRITRPWDITTSFPQLNNSITEVNKASIAAAKGSNSDFIISCTQLIQDYISNPSYGLMLMLANESNNGCNIDQIRHLGFAMGTHGGLGGPNLDIKYSYSSINCVDSCVSIFERRINPYVQGIWGNWRMEKSFVFYDDRKEIDPYAATDIRRNGEFKLFVPFWNIASPILTKSNYSKWTWNSEITRFNKRGLEIENNDPLGRHNSGLYGYNQTLPIAVAQNAKYRQIAFDGFEDYGYKNDSCDQRCPPVRPFDFSFYDNKMDSTEKHTGKASLRLNAWENIQINVPVETIHNDSLTGQLTSVTTYTGSYCGTRLDSITAGGNILTPVFSPLQGDSMILSVWVKESADCKTGNYTGNFITIIYSGTSGQIGSTVTLHPGGHIIEGWQRYEEMIKIPGNATSFQLGLQNNSANAVYFDDIRLHPYNSNMKSFVYNPTNLRLMAELDENNYASFYEYDDEGTLTRVKKETQRGIKTIQETKSSLTKQ